MNFLKTCGLGDPRLECEAFYDELFNFPMHCFSNDIDCLILTLCCVKSG